MLDIQGAVNGRMGVAGHSLVTLETAESIHEPAESSSYMIMQTFYETTGVSLPIIFFGEKEQNVMT